MPSRPGEEGPDRLGIDRDEEPETPGPANVPATPMAVPVIEKMRMIEPRVAPMVRRIAMSLALVLHQHDEARDDVERSDQR